jgi:hypothetical protein
MTGSLDSAECLLLYRGPGQVKCFNSSQLLQCRGFFAGDCCITELLLLFEVGAEPPHDGIRRMGWHNLSGALAAGWQQSSGHYVLTPPIVPVRTTSCRGRIRRTICVKLAEPPSCRWHSTSGSRCHQPTCGGWPHFIPALTAHSRRRRHHRQRAYCRSPRRG